MKFLQESVGVMWPRIILRALEGEIESLNYTLFGKRWEILPEVFDAQQKVWMPNYGEVYVGGTKLSPFRYLTKVSEHDRQSYTELVFCGKPPGGKTTLITCAASPHLIIQRPFYPCLNKTINKHIHEMEGRFPSMCF